jgi:hypothetical protein
MELLTTALIISAILFVVYKTGLMDLTSQAVETATVTSARKLSTLDDESKINKLKANKKLSAKLARLAGEDNKDLVTDKNLADLLKGIK